MVSTVMSMPTVLLIAVRGMSASVRRPRQIQSVVVQMDRAILHLLIFQMIMQMENSVHEATYLRLQFFQQHDGTGVVHSQIVHLISVRLRLTISTVCRVVDVETRMVRISIDQAIRHEVG